MMTAQTRSAPSHITLRSYQQTCVERVEAAYQRASKGGRALLVLPTGCGKTIVFTEIARRLGLYTLIIAHRQELLQQAEDKFRLVDPSAVIGQVGAGRHQWGYPITVASIQTLARPDHLKTLKRFSYGLVIIDESHHACSPGYQTVLDALPTAFVLGVTATPDRLDRQRIEHIFGPPVFSASIIDMIEQGHLSNLRAIAIPTTTSLDALHTRDGDFQLDELEVAVDTPDRNERITSAYLKHCHGRQALCFAVTVTHATHLCAAFTTAGVRAAVVSGETPLEERKRILRAYERGDVQVVSNVGVLTEGYDAIQTSCIVMARPTKSRALYVQAMGRGLRLAPGKHDCIVLDITDNCLKHRLEPLTLSKALGKALHNGESVIEAKEREEREHLPGDEQREHKERITKVTKRTSDLEIAVLERMDWKRGADGIFCLEVGSQKHQILLFPSETQVGYYSVWAKLAPAYQAQQWLPASPLSWAQEHAEMKARLIQADEKKLILVDSTAAWRARPASHKQVFIMRQFQIPFTDTITSGEASDLIGRAIAERERCKAAATREASQETTQYSKKKGRTSA